jgi:MOSC domain-containing protein
VATVSHLRASPVKGLNQTERDALTLVPGGIDEDRRFVIVEDGRALYGANLSTIAGATSAWDAAAGTLTITFADGESVSGSVATTGERLVALAYGERKVPGEVVDGPWAEALSARTGKQLTLIQSAVGVGAPGPITLLGDSSVERVAAELGLDELGARRFKMSVEIAGTAVYEEDEWSGRDVRIGAAVVRVGGQVPRCVLMTRDPDTQVRDHPVLKAILAHRTPMAGGEPPFGVYATVVEPGVIRVGDTVAPV